MLVKIVRFLRGYVDFTVKGKFPERFLNLTARNGINIWNATPNENGLSATMSVFDYKNIRKIAHKARVVIKTTGKHGAPFILHKYRFRLGLPIGAVIGIIILLGLSNFVWFVNVNGEKTLSDTYIKEVLKENGIDVGVYKNNLNVQSIERNVILNIKEIGWMSINIIGSTISVEIKENVKKPELVDNTIPYNIKADCDGVITKIKANNGVTKVLEGSGVKKGDLLVSGIIETKQETIQYVHAQAEVYADVISEKEISIPINYKYHSLAQNRGDYYRCSILWLDTPCSINFQRGNNFIKEYRKSNLYINNVTLPISLSKCESIELNTNNCKVDKGMAEKIINNDILLYELFEKPDSVLISKKKEIKKDKNNYNCKISYVFNENIAKEVKFSVTE